MNDEEAATFIGMDCQNEAAVGVQNESGFAVALGCPRRHVELEGGHLGEPKRQAAVSEHDRSN